MLKFKTSVFLFVALILVFSGCSSETETKTGSVKVSPLKYAVSDLEPHISAKTMKLHHDVHYRSYVKNSNRLMKLDKVKGSDPLEILKKIENKEKYSSLYNNLGQALNHDFFFKSITPEPVKPDNKILSEIKKSFKSYENFKKKFISAGKSQFGSGWLWLVAGDDGLEIITTSNADHAALKGVVPLLCVDVWEHSYYLDYNNKRGDYLENVTENLLNWDFAAENFNKADL
ncbi:MAG: superoxide dismutase [Thermodesulfobacteriota bacterium]